MKRILSLVLALSMVLSMFSFAFAGNFADLEGTDYEAAASALFELGIAKGKTEDSFVPGDIVKRSEMAAFLVRASGLEDAAEVSKGGTAFSDVDAGHWATGYINVATQYGIINGYPDGTFAPDATVSYAEAVTMVIRALGYKTVVEAKGTWPTNYIAKATELEVLEGVKYGKYTDGAIRGNVALLMWNMLIEPMWDVKSESEGNGLNYEVTGATMIDKYFDDYVYMSEDVESIVTDIEVEGGKVTLTLSKTKSGMPTTGVMELASGIDFLDLKGRVVSVLYNKEEEKLVMVTPSNNDGVIKGYRDELSGDKYVFSGDEELVWGEAASGDSDYVVSVLGTKKNVEYTTRYALNTSIIVEEVKAKNNIVKVNGSLELDEDVIVLIDGEWATASDIEVDDVLTELVEKELYVVSRNLVTGSFDAVTDEVDAEETRYFVTVNGNEFAVVDGNQPVVELDEEGDEVGTAKLADIIDDEEDEEYGKYYGEEVTLYLNFLGEVEKIVFGEVEENEDAGAFYVLTNAGAPSWKVADKKGETVYIELNGESYEVKSGDVPATNVSGDIVYVEFDSKDRVTAIYEIPSEKAAISGDYIIDTASGDGIYDEDAKTISGDAKIFRVTSSTTVVKVTPVEDDEDVVEYYEVETSKGAADLEGVKYGVVVSESGDTFNKAAYVFVWEDAKNTEKTHGIVEKYTKSNGIEYLTIDGAKYAVEDATKDPSFNKSVVQSNVRNYVGRAIEFIDNEDGITITMSYGIDELDDAKEIVEVEDGRAFVLSGDSYVYDIDVLAENLDDVKVFILNVSETETSYEFDSFELVDIADIKVKKEDRIALDCEFNTVLDLANAETILVIRGYEE